MKKGRFHLKRHFHPHFLICMLKWSGSWLYYDVATVRPSIGPTPCQLCGTAPPPASSTLPHAITFDVSAKCQFISHWTLRIPLHCLSLQMTPFVIFIYRRQRRFMTSVCRGSADKWTFAAMIWRGFGRIVPRWKDETIHINSPCWGKGPRKGCIVGSECKAHNRYTILDKLTGRFRNVF